MFALLAVAEPLLVSLSFAFTQPTFQRALVLVMGAIVAPGRHTLTHLLRTVPFASRPWDLPVLAALYQPEELNRQEVRAHMGFATPPP